MSVTNKKIDALRRLLLGNLYQECKDNPMGVSRERLEQHLEKIKGEGCIGECTVEEFVKTCQLKTHYPTCVSGEYRECIEGIGERSKGVDKFYYDQYKTSKMFENEPDTDEEEEGDEKVCNVCGLDGDDELGLPVEEMSCGHHSHKGCLIKVAQQKGRDNAECPECRKEFSLEEVPVPVRTTRQRQEDSERRARFNMSQMGFHVEEEEEQTEEDRLSNGIIEGIEHNTISEVIPEIREFYTRDINRRTLIEYVKKWFVAIIGLLEDEENININEVKRLIDTIFQVNITLTSINNRIIKSLNQLYTRGNRVRKEGALYIISSFTKHLISREESLVHIIDMLIANSADSLIEEVMRISNEENYNNNLKNSINTSIEELDLDRLNDSTKELIKSWFERNGYEPPSFERVNVAQQLSDQIVEYIKERNFMYAQAGIEEFYERDFEDEEEYLFIWYKEILNQITTGELDTDNFKTLIDVMFDMNHVIFFSRGNLKKIEDISSLGETQKQQILYLFSRIISIYIEYFRDEEQLGIILENIINLKSKELMKAVMIKADEIDGGVETLRDHLIDAIENANGLEEGSMRTGIERWFRTHNFEFPSFDRD